VSNRQPRWRAERRRASKKEGIVLGRRQWVWIVEPDSLYVIPEGAKAVAVRGMASSSNRIWLWPTDAKRLIREVQRRGGRCDSTRVEIRNCGVCAKPLVGLEAEKRRKLDEGSADGRLLPCGPKCQDEAATGIWRKLKTRTPTRAG
jgi:hypothetical protein